MSIFSTLNTPIILLGLIFIIMYLIIKRDKFHYNNINLYEIVFRCFMYAASIILGACTVYYAIIGEYAFGLTQEDIRLPISIGGSILIVRGIWSLCNLLRKKK